MTERFSLKWNDYHSNVANSFGTLRNEDYLCDVTLVSDDQQQVPVHKLVLSACSEYFQAIFKNGNSRSANMMICLEGVSGQDLNLNNCLDYMYTGEVQIYQYDLDKFLNIAQRFQMKGLQNDAMKDGDNLTETYDSA